MNVKQRKNKNPSEVDAWLDSLGYYRKTVAYDETCLFRAISEQIFETQFHHKRVRKECIDYARIHFDEFRHLVSDREEWEDRLDAVAVHMAVCGHIELEIASRKYRRDVWMFDGVRFQIEKIVDGGYDKKIMLCVISRDHYDTVYNKEYIAKAALCQSIAYELLYENVLQVPDVQATVHSMLYDKNTFPLYKEENSFDKKTEENTEKNGKQLRTESTSSTALVSAPFPYKVAKALDPTIYRNIEFDAWVEIRREFQLGDWYHGDGNLILGTNCKLRTEKGYETCSIQEFGKDRKECVVFVWSTAEKRTVKYEDLSPEDDAKPWPLPYRFSRNLTITIPPKPFKLEEVSASRKKNKKPEIKGSLTVSEEAAEHNVRAFEGCPLVQSNSLPSPDKTEKKEICTEPVQQFFWEAPWSQVAATTPEPVMWPPSPSIPNMLGYSKPTLPPIQIPEVPQQGSTYVAPPPPSPYIYPYPSQSYTYNMIPSTEYPTTPEIIATTTMATPPSPSVLERKESSLNDPLATCKFVLCPNPNANYAAATPTNLVHTPLTPVNPQVLTPVFMPPGTPVVYGPALPQVEAVPEVGQAQLVPMYSPAVDVQYVSQPQFVCPTQLAAPGWYSPVNAQGFFFPTPRGKP